MSSIETMRTWPKHIRNITEVPWEFKDAFMSTFDYERDFPYCVYVPDNGTWHEPTKMLCMQQDSYTLFQSNGTGTNPIVYALKDINRMEHGLILLSSWLELGGMVEGRPSSHRLTFNTVREELFKPFFKRFRRLHTPEDIQGQNETDDKFDFLLEKSYKFLNYGKSALLDGERAVDVIYQPGIRVRWFKKLPFLKNISNGTLFIRTETELILLREQSVKQITSKYGVITDFIPLSKIKTAWTSQSAYEGIAEWTVEMKNGEQLKTLVSEENKVRVGSILKQSQYGISNTSLYGTYH